LLEFLGTIRRRALTGPNAKVPSGSDEDDIEDPHAFIIPSLLIQISDLLHQANSNSNLVQSSYRVSILEEIFNDGSECMGLEKRKRIVQKWRKFDRMVRDRRLLERSVLTAELGQCVHPQFLECHFTVTYSRLQSLGGAPSLPSAKPSSNAKHKQMESNVLALSVNFFTAANELVATKQQTRARAGHTRHVSGHSCSRQEPCLVSAPRRTFVIIGAASPT
jgi:hypothetical protein